MFGALCINVSEELLRTISSHLTAWLLECDGNYAKNPIVTVPESSLLPSGFLWHQRVEPFHVCRSSLLRCDLNRINL